MHNIDRQAFRDQLKRVQYLPEQSISAEVKQRLPVGHRVMSFHTAKDADDQEYVAIMVRFSDVSGVRVANFRLATGEYVDDFIL